MAAKLFATEPQGPVLVITPKSELMGVDEHCLNAELERISGEIKQLGVTHLVVDFGQAAFFGSLMLAAMLRLSRQVSAGRGKLVLCNVSEMSQDVLRITGLDSRWPVYASREAAFASFDV